MSLQTAAIKAVGMCVSTGLMGIILWKMMRYLDPHYETNENAKRKLEELKRILNLDPKLELNSHEIRLATQIVLPEEGVDLEDIGGCSDILRQVEDNVLMPLLLKTSNIRLPSAYYNPPMGILLHGPPGCGKTLIARAIAKSAGAFFINFDIASFSDMWYGETSKLTKALFTLSQKIQPCIIFIDEIDSILRSRSNHDHEATAIMKTQFMSLWDGFLNSEKTVIIIGATNRPSDVDDAILRRLPFRIHVPKPDAASRAQIIKVLMKKENKCPDFDYCKVADSTASLSGSDLKEVVRIACLTKYSEAVQHILSNGTADNPPSQQICSVQISHDDLIMAAQTFNKNSKDLNVNKGAFLMDMLKLD